MNTLTAKICHHRIDKAQENQTDQFLLEKKHVYLQLVSIYNEVSIAVSLVHAASGIFGYEQ